MLRRGFLTTTHRAAAVTVAWALGVVGAKSAERNYWPIWVGQTQEASSGEDRVVSWVGAGPLLFAQPLAPAPGEASVRTGGFRPFYVWKKDPAGETREGYGLYPFFTYRTSLGGAERWSFFNLINYSTVPPSPVEAARGATVSERGFEVWPFYFSRQTGNPELDYRAVFPIAGTLKHRLGYDRLSWGLFPLYVRFEKRQMVRTATPWPFIKVTSGDGHRGFEFWPLFGQREKPGVYRNQFLIWPLFYRNVSALDQPEPELQLGALPFFAMDRSPGYVSKTWLWPFFGYVDRTSPYRYHATNYFWPFFVQGEGDQRRVNRWAPFYTHSVIKGTDKTWILWPLWRQVSWNEGAVDQTKQQFLYFLYNATTQVSATNPNAAPARKVHVWPLLSFWDNGAGRRQVQALSPFEVFFPHNEPMRLAWSPLFAIYRYDHRPDGQVRHSWLWDGVTYQRRPWAGAASFHLGPLLSVESNPERKRVSLIKGLLGWERKSGAGWRIFFGEFAVKNRAEQETNP